MAEHHMAVVAAVDARAAACLRGRGAHADALLGLTGADEDHAHLEAGAPSTGGK